MAYRLHLIRVNDPAGKPQYQAWCGYESASTMFMTTAPTHPGLCTKCSTKYNAHQLKQHPIDYHLGDRLDLTKDNRRFAYKSVYPILATTDDLLGYLVIENGWGKHWHMCPLTVKVADVRVEHPDIQVVMGGRLDRSHRVSEIGSVGAWLSKEAALQAVPSLVENGLLKSAEIVLAEAKAVHAELRSNLWTTEIRRQRAASERQETMERIRVGFVELLARQDVTNFQRTAVLDAAKLLGVTLGE